MRACPNALYRRWCMVIRSIRSRALAGESRRELHRRTRKHPISGRRLHDPRGLPKKLFPHGLNLTEKKLAEVTFRREDASREC